MSARKLWMVVCIDDQTINSGQGLGERGIKFTSQSRPQGFYASERDAEREATALATTNPMKPYAVMSISKVLETGTPEVHEKAFSDAGELTIV